MENLIGSTIGGCRIDAKIGEGGMGSVYIAHHLALDIPVAVKILHNVSDVPHAQERFLREARIAARLRHPHIVAVLNVGCEQGHHFIVEEYIDGESLQSVIARKGKIPPEEVLAIAVDILKALQLAFENGIVHRDIKPENILIDAKGVAKLADLGLARRENDLNLTQPNTMLGSPYYVAPEQAENPSAADCRADIYSLGCTLYHMLTGNAPFPGTTVIEVVINHMKKPAPLLIDTLPGISPRLSAAVARMMEKDPAQRYQTPLEAIAALEGCLHESHVDAAPLLQKATVRKNRYSLRLPVIGTLVLICFAGMVVWRSAVKPQTAPIPGNARAIGPALPDTSLDSMPAAHPSSVDNNRSVPKRKIIKKQAPVPAPLPVKESSNKSINADDQVLSAVKIGDTEALKNLLASGSSPNGGPGASTTPLHEAVRRGSTEETQLLLNFGANPNIRDVKGDTPLHYALREDASLMVRMLLKKGANPNLPDQRGKTPLKIAQSVSSEMEKMVQQYGGR